MSIKQEMADFRYAIGIDLGTTNCSLAYVNLSEPDAAPIIFEIPQWEQAGSLVTSPTLPSFYYVATKGESKRAHLRLPQQDAESVVDFAVGRLARWQSSQTPGRVIHQAKSWLCHEGVDREECILPWQIGELIGSERRSPVEVSAAFLRHLRESWDRSIAKGDDSLCFARQHIVITVPASFDDTAQRLTLKAAALAGYPSTQIKLLEEPQAAFYHWLTTTADSQHSGQVLICDIGGGTTDFSLFSVQDDGQISREAVGEHLLLGGDNIDLAIAKAVEHQILPEGGRLSSREWTELVFASRLLKEEALKKTTVVGDDTAAMDELLSVSIAGDGASLMASAKTASLSRREILNLVMDGFFPVVGGDAKPQVARLGFTSLGLRYAADTAITRHLAAFLAGRKVDAVLFNGGSLTPPALQRAVVRLLASWQNGVEPVVLKNNSMDLAVALGAAHFSSLQVKRSLLIKSGYARSVYIEVDAASLSSDASASELKLVCIVPQGFDGAQDLTLDQIGLKVRAGQPVRFQLYTSNKRPSDQVGGLAKLDLKEFKALPAVTAKIDLPTKSTDQLIDVSLGVSLAETGLLALRLLSTDPRYPGSWQLDFNLRVQTSPLEKESTTDAERPKYDSAKLKDAASLIDALFGKKKIDVRPSSPRTLLRDLEASLDLPREKWSPDQLRALWSHLADGMTRRSRSPEHEAQWLSLAGYALRPGFGHVHDEWRMLDLWRSYEQGMFFPRERQVEDQWWIMWRRVAGGLDKNQQAKIWDRIYPAVRKGDAQPELYLLAGSLERIEMQEKIRLGNQLVQQIAAGRVQNVNQKMWALARLASRVPLYGGAHQIVRPETVVSWFEALKGLRPSDAAYAKLPLFLSQAGRMIGDREYDLAGDVRDAFVAKLKACKSSPEEIAVVEAYVPVDYGTRSQLFGEALPVGLVLS